MIGRIAGRLDYRASDHVLIDVRGVGYLVYCSERTLAALPAPGEAVALYTDLLVREDNLQLFGFPTLLEKEWHRLLTSVQGVGAKVSLAILGTLGPEGVGRAITLGDAAAVKSAPGVGPKLAARVVNELKEKAAGVMAMGSFRGGALSPDPGEVVEADVPPPTRAAAPVQVAGGRAEAQADALSALVNLGYGQSEAAQAVASVEGEDASALIRAALKLLAPKG
ncbi:Holliday junction branch migration protein RuvA [Vannielia litorea]|uniref:Holliday junction branch migration complex subunit RuvA n=1 Tax=Vannielia litorea TaxID=1217970 RepID=A0A1N6DW70_9RHOB|nr:Holliday junction branch migration protein RuvA [Vannielia litorea]SIN74953.1 Holliday junction DNA helicase subunit RuvA [Vannielia litorea]